MDQDVVGASGKEEKERKEEKNKLTVVALNRIISFLAGDHGFLEDALGGGLDDTHIRTSCCDPTVRRVGVVHAVSECDEVRLFDDDYLGLIVPRCLPLPECSAPFRRLIASASAPASA